MLSIPKSLSNLILALAITAMPLTVVVGGAYAQQANYWPTVYPQNASPPPGLSTQWQHAPQSLPPQSLPQGAPYQPQQPPPAGLSGQWHHGATVVTQQPYQVVQQQQPIQQQPPQLSYNQPQYGQVSHSTSHVVPPDTRGMNAEQAGQTILKHILASNGLSSSTVKKFEIQNDDTLNAATDGKQVFFTRSLWNTLENDDQRAFVLSHEVSHITLNHIPKTIGRQVGFGLLGRLASNVLGGTGGALASTAVNAGLQLYNLKFSRGAEYEADERGLQYLRNAGYSTQAAVETMEILQQAGGSGTPEFLRSHPMEANRIDRLASQIY